METDWMDVSPHDLVMIEPSPASGIQGVRVGRLMIADLADGVWVSYEGQPGGDALPARSTVPVAPHDEGRRVLLVFENSDPERPIITGFIQDQPVAVSLDKDAVDEVRVDGKWVNLEAKKELVLQCGKSSLTLRADGKIVVRGLEIVSRARRTNKVKGGTVLIN